MCRLAPAADGGDAEIRPPAALVSGPTCAGRPPRRRSAPPALYSRADMRLLFVLDQWPELSETFVVNELQALRRLGHDVRVQAAQPAAHPNPEAPADVDVHVLARRRPRARAVRDLLWLRGAGRWPARATSPGAGAGGARSGRARCARWRRPRGAIVERGDEHLHAHFAAGAALDAMRLAALTGRTFSVTAHAYDIFLTPRNLREKLDARRRGLHRLRLQRRATCAASCRGRTCTRSSWASTSARSERTAPLPQRPHGAGGRPARREEGLRRARSTRVAQLPDVRLRIVGDGPLRAQLEARARSAASGRVELAGSRAPAGVRAALERADVLAMPCVVARDGDRDSMPVVVKEAMAMELLVVASDEVGLPECVLAPWGVLAPPGDAEALRGGAARRARAVAAGAPRAGRAAREWVRAHADVDAETARMAQVLRTIGRAPPPRAHTQTADVLSDIIAPGRLRDGDPQALAALVAVGGWAVVVLLRARGRGRRRRARRRARVRDVPPARDRGRRRGGGRSRADPARERARRGRRGARRARPRTRRARREEAFARASPRPLSPRLATEVLRALVDAAPVEGEPAAGTRRGRAQLRRRLRGGRAGAGGRRRGGLGPASPLLLRAAQRHGRRRRRRRAPDAPDGARAAPVWRATPPRNRRGAPPPPAASASAAPRVAARRALRALPPAQRALVRGGARRSCVLASRCGGDEAPAATATAPRAAPSRSRRRRRRPAPGAGAVAGRPRPPRRAAGRERRALRGRADHRRRVGQEIRARRAAQRHALGHDRGARAQRQPRRPRAARPRLPAADEPRRRRRPARRRGRRGPRRARAAGACARRARERAPRLRGPVERARARRSLFEPGGLDEPTVLVPLGDSSAAGRSGSRRGGTSTRRRAVSAIVRQPASIAQRCSGVASGGSKPRPTTSTS